MDKIKVLLCDDMKYICQSFKILIDREEDMEVVGTANDMETCMDILIKQQPDVALLDIQMSRYNDGIILLEKILKEKPDTKCIMLTIHEEDDMVFKSLSLGACDYLLKSNEPSYIIDSIRNAYAGKTSMNPCIARKLLDECKKVEEQRQETLSLLHSVALLTASEYKILRMIYEGNSYAEIAKQRFVEEGSVRTQVSKILKKFNAKSMKNLIQQLQQMDLFGLRF